MSKKKSDVKQESILLDDVLDNVNIKDIDPEGIDGEEIKQEPQGDALDEDSDEDDGVEHDESIQDSNDTIDTKTSSAYFKELYVVPDNQRVTSEIMSIYEFSEVIGIRTTQISEGNTVFTDVKNITDHREMALKELFDRKCPLKIRRKIGNRVEIWSCNEMSVPGDYRKNT